MTRRKRSETPSIEDWQCAVSVIQLIRAFEKASFRNSMEDLARVLEHEGLAAHRSADRLEKRSAFSYAVDPRAHAKDAIIGKLSSYADSSYVIGFVVRLHNGSIEDPDRLRHQAAILLDGAETIDRLLKWYAARVKSIKARNLTNDTIVAIMLEWGLRPRETSKHLREHEIDVSEGAIKQALSKGRGQSLPGHEPTLLSFVPSMIPRRQHAAE